LLRKLLPLSPQAVRYVEHVASGTELFRAICELDMEGIVAKQVPKLPMWASWPSSIAFWLLFARQSLTRLRPYFCRV
jgi:hypothetical protein